MKDFWQVHCPGCHRTDVILKVWRDWEPMSRYLVVQPILESPLDCHRSFNSHVIVQNWGWHVHHCHICQFELLSYFLEAVIWNRFVNEGRNAARSVAQQSKGISVLMYPTPRKEWHPNYVHWVKLTKLGAKKFSRPLKYLSDFQNSLLTQVYPSYLRGSVYVAKLFQRILELHVFTNRVKKLPLKI